MKGKIRINLTLTIVFTAMLVASAIVILGEVGVPLHKDESAIGGLDYYHQTEFSSDPKNIYIENTTTGEKRVIYTSQKEYIDRLTLSPNRELIVAIEPLDETTNTLLIINTAGEVMHTIPDNVRRYDWSPDGKRIAYITGENYEGGVGFLPDGIYLFDPIMGEKLSINKDFPYPRIEQYEGLGFDLKWAVHDGNLYIEDFDYAGGIYLYDPNTGETRPVSHHGIYFSPDGKFYYDRGAENEARMYIAATDEDISERIKARFGRLPINWISGYPHHVRAVKTEYEPEPNDDKKQKVVCVKGTKKIIQKTHYLYDVEKDMIVDERIERL